MTRTAIATGLMLLLTTRALAGGGVIEINQAAALAGGVTPTDTPGFPVTLDSPGSYVLTGNLTVNAANTTGIFISASRVTLDLAGFQISGPGSCSGNGTGFGANLTCTHAPDGAQAVLGSTGVSGIRVQNGALRGFGGYGIALSGIGSVDRLYVSENASGGIITGAGGGSVVTDSIAERNKGDGIVNTRGQVRGCRVIENFGVGIVTSASLIEGNMVRGSGLQGIQDSGGSVIRANSVIRNSLDGIKVISRGTLVIDNSTSSNGQAGISALITASIQRNVSNSNTGAGMYLVPELDPTGPAPAYRENVVTGNGSTVVGGVNLGNNSCSGTSSATTSCP